MVSSRQGHGPAGMSFWDWLRFRIACYRRAARAGPSYPAPGAGSSCGHHAAGSCRCWYHRAPRRPRRRLREPIAQARLTDPEVLRDLTDRYVTAPGNRDNVVANSWGGAAGTVDILPAATHVATCQVTTDPSTVPPAGPRSTGVGSPRQQVATSYGCRPGPST